VRQEDQIINVALAGCSQPFNCQLVFAKRQIPERNRRLSELNPCSQQLGEI